MKIAQLDRPPEPEQRICPRCNMQLPPYNQFAYPVCDRCRSTCLECESPMPTKRGGSVYCSDACAGQVRSRAHRAVNIVPDISTSKRGAQAELIVCADLLSKGYDIFRAVNPDSACDVIAIKGASIYRIQVRTASIDPDSYAVHVYTSGVTPTTTDILAAVIRNQEIMYLDCDFRQVVL